MHFFQDTVSALCYTVIRERCRPPDSDEDFPQNQVVRFVLGQHEGSSWFVRTPIRALTIGFGLWGLIRQGRCFHASRHEVRAEQWAAWRTSRVRLCRDLMTFYESLTIFSWFSYRTPDVEPAAEALRRGSTRTAG